METAQHVEVASQTPKNNAEMFAIIGLVLGVINLCSWFLPICGFPLTIAGIILGILGLKSPDKKWMGIVAIVISAIAMILTIVNAVAGVWMMNSGYTYNM